MGAAMASNLLARGHEVHVRDLIAQREEPLLKLGAVRQPDPAALLNAVEAVMIVVETAAQIHDVLSGPRGLLTELSQTDQHAEAKGVILCSTVAPADTTAFALALAQVGAAPIDGPISGGPERAADGSMSIMLAAEPAYLERFESLLADLASKRFIVSAQPGDGARAKLANNLAGGAYLAAASEALALAVSMGLDPEIMQPLMAASSGQAWVADDRLPRGAAGLMPAVGAATRVLKKDLTLAVAAAKDAGSPVPMGQAALQRFEAACDDGMAEMDDSSLFTLYRRQVKKT